ncbi:hypothetical protein EZV73_06540 [Acidaminobacter sp. JC074]|uniref:hypothetical protein n=1 Tax=Acidaminobacter sp. JC074 TaxID=2530199 RepID=UPI001F0D03A1|nr:hypothetical protein [Acidaminobacter sp. JC074]MCH4887220.1 hypothetical protein [Acidaminobacter sp. JC074]
MGFIKDFRKYKIMMQILLGVGLLALASAVFVSEDALKGILMGFGTSVTSLSGINLIFMYIKQKKDDAYESDMNLEFADERLKLNKLKVLAYSGIVGMMALAFSNVIHLLFDTDVLIGNMIIIFGYVAVLVGLKVYYRNK